MCDQQFFLTGMCKVLITVWN